jgi:hypothetical protein
MPILKGFPNILSYECSKKLIEQMEKNICKIRIGEEQATGFFCKIPFPDRNNLLPVLITAGFFINEKILYNENQKIELIIKEEKSKIYLDLKDRIKYINQEYNTTIIEIKETDKIKNYLELNEYLIKDIENYQESKGILDNEFIENTIYTLQYPEGELSVSYGLLNTIYIDKKFKFSHRCSTRGGSSGAPILTVDNKVIGMHVEGHKNFNIGTFLNYPIKDFILKNGKIDEILLSNFNKKYNLNIEDFNLTKLNLTRKFSGNELIKDLSKLNFKKLKELYLNDNDISDIKDLEKINLEKLEILDLSNNDISNIDIFEKLKLYNLKKLFLIRNDITDIKVFARVNFENLETLDLRKNKIDKEKNSYIINDIKSKIKEFYM